MRGTMRRRIFKHTLNRGLAHLNVRSFMPMATLPGCLTIPTITRIMKKDTIRANMEMMKKRRKSRTKSTMVEKMVEITLMMIPILRRLLTNVSLV
jgi:hypothetical protein